jgi:nucleoside phosphorylase
VAPPARTVTGYPRGLHVAHGHGAEQLDATPRTPTYLSHSYRVPDRDLNRFFHDLFWDNGFAFTVDPQSHSLSTTHLEMMMRRSACFLGVVTRRDEQPYYRCSPFAVYEYGLAVQAHKPRLLIVEAGVPQRYFPEEKHTVVFNREHLNPEDYLPPIRRLALESRAYVDIGNRPLGEVGLLLPVTRPYAEAAVRIKEILHEAGYSPVELALDEMDGAAAARTLDRLDFVVADVGAPGASAGLVPFVLGRFVPCVKLVFHQPGQSRAVEIPRLLLDRALETASAANEVAIWWSDLPQLEVELRKRVQWLHAPRHEFLSKGEGRAYFRSLGRVRGPVFISSAREDSALARGVVDQLLSYNVQTFHYLFQNTLRPGEYWQPVLPRKIEESRLFVPLLSRAYWNSPWCRHEFDIASTLHRAGRLTMIPYFLDDCQEHEIDVQGVSVADVSPGRRAARVASHLDGYLLTQGETGHVSGYSVGAERGPVPDVDIAVVTVLDQEYSAMHRHLESPARINGTRDAPNQYSWVVGTITSELQGAYRVVLALGKTGNENALLAARNTIDAFRPDCLLMVGVAGALDERLNCGDVVVSERICGYEYGKLEEGFHPRPDWSFPADQSIAAAARTIETLQPAWDSAVTVPAPARGRSQPQVLVGQIASGNKVVDDISGRTFAPVLRLWPRLIAVEMEGLGGVLAVDDARERGHLTHFSMIRGISDRPLRTPRRRAPAGTAHVPQTQQRELWKPRAAAVAAAFTANLIRTAWPRPPRARHREPGPVDPLRFC